MFVGGGYAGLEGVAELHGLRRATRSSDYPRCRETGMRFAADRRRAADHAARSSSSWPTSPRSTLRKRGVEILLETTVDRGRRELGRARRRGHADDPRRTVCWTAGVEASPVAGSLGLPLDHGRIVVQRVDAGARATTTSGRSVTSPPIPIRRGPGEPCPPTAQHAIRQGKLLGKNVAGGARAPGAGQAVHVQDARRVRRHSGATPPSRTSWGCVSGLPRVGDLPLLPPRLGAGAASASRA